MVARDRGLQLLKTGYFLGTSYPLRVSDTFWNQSEVVAAQHCTCAKCHWPLPLQWLIENIYIGVPVVAQWLANLTRNHEVAGSIPGLAQWVKDLALP